MFILKIENSQHQVITLTQNESIYQVLNVDGLNPPKAQINRSTVAGMDGTKFNSSKLEERNIVITLKVNGNVEQNRLMLYKHLQTKEWCKIFYKNNTRDVYAEGYIESIEGNYFNKNQTLQISIICSNPYFQNANEIVDDISKSLPKFTFPFSINVGNPIEFSTIENTRITNVVNDGESKTGVIIEIFFNGTVRKIKIRNNGTEEKFTIVNEDYFIQGDLVIINTNKGKKSVTKIRNAQSENIFAKVDKSSKFFQLDLGSNYFSYECDDGETDTNINIVFKHYNIYEGV